MTVAYKFILSSLLKKDIKGLTSIAVEWLDVKEKIAYNFVVEYYKEHTELPPVEIFIDRYKLDSTEVKGRAGFYKKELRNRYISTVLGTKIPKVLAELKGDAEEGVKNLQGIINSLKLTTASGEYLLASDGTDERYEEYIRRSTTGGVTHLSSGIHAFDTTFYGYKEEDLITLAGLGGQGKTWLLLLMVIKLESTLEEDSGEILLVSNEMPASELNERLDCMRFGICYEDFMKGSLDRKVLRRYKDGLERLKKSKSKIRIVDRVMFVDDLYTLVQIYKPCMIFIDGSYLFLSMQKGWEKIVEITQGLKRLAKDTKTPITNTTQLRKADGKSGKTLGIEGQGDFAFGPSYTQDSDIAFRMYQDPEMIIRGEVGIEVAKGRRIKPNTRYTFIMDLVYMELDITVNHEIARDAETVF